MDIHLSHIQITFDSQTKHRQWTNLIGSIKPVTSSGIYLLVVWKVRVSKVDRNFRIKSEIVSKNISRRTPIFGIC